MRLVALLIGCCSALHFPAHAEQIKATYVEIAETYSYEQLNRTRTKPSTIRVWRAGDVARAELEFVASPSLPPGVDGPEAARYACSFAIAIDTPQQLFLFNRINRRGIKIAKTNEFKPATDPLLLRLSCFGLCALGEEPEWFKRNGKLANSALPSYMFQRGNDEWTLQTVGAPDAKPKAIDYRIGSDAVHWDYVVVGNDIPADTGLFEAPGDVDWMVMPTPPTPGMMYRSISAPPRPEYFLEAGYHVITGDFNFDAHQDFAIFTGASAKAPYYDYFVYRPANDTFSFQPELSLTANARFDAARKAVYTFHNGGAAGLEYTSDKFVWKETAFIHISRVRQEYKDGVTFERSYYRMEDGQERLVKQITVENPDDSWDLVKHHDEL